MSTRTSEPCAHLLARPAQLPQRRRRAPYVALATALLAALLGAAGLAALRPAGSRLVVRNSVADEVTELRDKACSEYPYLKFKMTHPILHNNLAGKGPDTGPEGIVYDTIDLGQGAGTELGHQVLMVVNATSSGYSPFAAIRNGMEGKYGTVNLKSGSSVDLLFRFYDRRSGEPYVLKEAAWTFFDLDTGEEGHSVESVTFHKNYKRYHLTDHTELKVEDLGERTRFSGSTFGVGADNPVDPMRLTHQQKNRAVTLTFENLKELRVTLSATLGVGPRFFIFVSRPSLMCAVTVQEGYKPPLDDLIAEPPLQISVQSDYDVRETFVGLLVSPGETIKKGSPVFNVKLPDGSVKTYTSHIDGTVKAAQTQLLAGDDLHLRLDNKTIVVVERPTLAPLATSLPSIVPGGPAFATHDPLRDMDSNDAGTAAPGAPDPESLDGYWCGPACEGGPGHEGTPPGSAPGGEERVPQVSKGATFAKYLKEPGDPVSVGEAIMTVLDGDKIVAVTSPELGVVKSREEGMSRGSAIPEPGPLALMDIRPEVSGSAKFVEYLKLVGDPVAKGDPIMKVKDIVGEEVVIKAKTVGVVKERQEAIKVGEPIALARDQDLMTIGQVPALPTGPNSLKAGIVPDKEGQELVEIKVKRGDLIQEGDVVAVVKDTATGKESEVLADHDGLVTAVNNQIKPGDPIDRSEDGNLVITGKFPPLEVKPPNQWPSNSDAAGPGSTFVKYHVQPGEVVEAGDTIATVKKADGNEVPVKANKRGVVMRIQDALQPGMALDDVMQDKNLATIGDFDKLPALPVKPPDQWPSNNKEEENGPNCEFVKYHVKPEDVVHTGDRIATVKRQDGVEVDILADKPGVVKAIQNGLKPGMNMDDLMEDDNLATIEKLPPLDVKPGEAGCCTPSEGDCPSGAPKGPFPPSVCENCGDGSLSVGEAAANSQGAIDATGRPTSDSQGSPKGQTSSTTVPLSPEDKGPWAFERWSKEKDDPVIQGEPIAVVKNSETGEEREVLASKSGNVIKRQEALKKGDVVDDVMKDADLAVIGKFNPLNIGLTEKGIGAPFDAVFVKWYHLVGEDITPGDSIAQVQLGSKTEGGRRLVSNMDIPSPGHGRVIEEMDLKPGQSIGQQSLSPTIAKIDVGWPWWLLLLGALMLLCCVFFCFYRAMQKPRPPYKPMPGGADTEVDAGPEPVPDGLRLDFQDDSKVRTVYAEWRPLGIKHNFVAPIVAHDFTINSYAKQALGIKEGWKLRRIGDEELHDNPRFTEVNDKLHQYMKDFRLWPLPLEFSENRESNDRKLFKFTERPIGIEFKNRAPIQVEKVFVGSPAYEAGVQVGWYVTRIGDFEVEETTTFQEVMTAFKEGVGPLDDVGKTYATQEMSYDNKRDSVISSKRDSVISGSKRGSFRGN